MKTMRYILLLILCIAIPTAFAADVKISALPAASSANTTDEYPANQSGTTNKVTGAQIASLAITNVVTGATGTSGPIETWQVLTANCASNSTTTMATCVTTNSLSAGAYDFEYHVVYQTASTAAGIRMQIGTTGIWSRFRSTAIAQATQSGTNIAGSNMGKNGFTVAGWATRSAANSSNQEVFSSGGVDSANSDIPVAIQGSFNLTSSGAQLFLQAATELSGTNATIQADTVLILRKIR